MNVRICMDLTVSDDCSDLDDLADRVFDLVGTDPDDVCPDIETIDNIAASLLTDGSLHL